MKEPRLEQSLMLGMGALVKSDRQSRSPSYAHYCDNSSWNQEITREMTPWFFPHCAKSRIHWSRALNCKGKYFRVNLQRMMRRLYRTYLQILECCKVASYERIRRNWLYNEAVTENTREWFDEIILLTWFPHNFPPPRLREDLHILKKFTRFGIRTKNIFGIPPSKC